MSGFDSNPFGDPEVNNPFQDPAVMQATRGTESSQKGLEDYNPFADQSRNVPTSVRGAANPPQYQPPMTQPQVASQPAVMQPTPEPPPTYTASAQQRISTEELQRRQEELERKAAELQRKEEELRNAPFNTRANNWPPLPDKFCFGPCFYQDINLEIPLEFQKIVRTLYYLWMFHSCVLVLNVLGGLSLFVGTDLSGSGPTFGLSILYFLLFTPFSYVCWFRPVYKAFRSDSSFNFFVFFFIFFFQCCVSGLFAIGFPGTGSCGFINGIATVHHGSSNVAYYAVGGIVLIIGFMFGVVALMDVIMLLKVHRIYRSTGASFAKAQQEFTSGVLRNEHVQNAAANVAASTVRQQMSGAGDNRY